MLFLNIFRFHTSNLMIIKYIIQYRIVSSLKFLYQDTHLDDCTAIYGDTECMVSLLHGIVISAIQSVWFHPYMELLYHYIDRKFYCFGSFLWWTPDVIVIPLSINSLTSRQNCRLFTDDTFKRILFNDNLHIWIHIGPKCVPKCPIYFKSALSLA